MKSIDVRLWLMLLGLYLLSAVPLQAQNTPLEDYDLTILSQSAGCRALNITATSGDIITVSGTLAAKKRKRLRCRLKALIQYVGDGVITLECRDDIVEKHIYTSACPRSESGSGICPTKATLDFQSPSRIVEISSSCGLLDIRLRARKRSRRFWFDLALPGAIAEFQEEITAQWNELNEAFNAEQTDK